MVNKEMREVSHLDKVIRNMEKHLKDKDNLLREYAETNNGLEFDNQLLSQQNNLLTEKNKALQGALDYEKDHVYHLEDEVDYLNNELRNNL